MQGVIVRQIVEGERAVEVYCCATRSSYIIYERGIEKTELSWDSSQLLREGVFGGLKLIRYVCDPISN